MPGDSGNQPALLPNKTLSFSAWSFPRDISCYARLVLIVTGAGEFPQELFNSLSADPLGLFSTVGKEPLYPPKKMFLLILARIYPLTPAPPNSNHWQSL